MNRRPEEKEGNKPRIYEVHWCHWHLHNLFMRIVMESPLYSTPVLQVTKDGRDTEVCLYGMIMKIKKRRKLSETKWIKKNRRYPERNREETDKGKDKEQKPDWGTHCSEVKLKEKRKPAYECVEQLPGERGEYFNKPVHVDSARHIRYLCPYTLHTNDSDTAELEFTIYTDSEGNSISYSCRAQRGGRVDGVRQKWRQTVTCGLGSTIQTWQE